MSDTTYITVAKNCSFCPLPAKYDFRQSNGQWANGCEQHWKDHRASANLGTGFGQLLVVGEPPEKTDEEIGNELQEALMAGDFDLAEELCGDRDPMDFL